MPRNVVTVGPRLSGVVTVRVPTCRVVSLKVGAVGVFVSLGRKISCWLELG